MIQVDVSALAIDAGTNTPLVLLKESEGERVVPIWIGYPEASAIAMAKSYQKKEIERPLTHDLMVILMNALNVKLSKVLIDELEGSTYKAKLFIESSENKDYYIDSRPSDAIALALRSETPIYIEEVILNKVVDDDKSKSNIDSLKKRLRDIDPSDFGKYRF